jgi:hypothetical protein
MQKTTKNTRIVSLLGVLAALCLAIQLSPRPPNVEFTSLFTFIVGYMFGSVVGIAFGSFVMFVNGFFSPWGFAGVNMPFQIAGIAVIGLAGGLYKRYFRSWSETAFYLEVAVLGAFLTVLYDLITNFGVALFYMVAGVHPTLAVMTALAYGTPFSLIHVFSNILVFGAIFFPLVQTLTHAKVVENLG